jgi:hypothetical protein
MSNSINSLSPTFRDYLLLKNLVTDTVVDNGLQSLLAGIGYPVATETLPNAVQPSNSINDTGTLYQELNTILNTYQGGAGDYSQVEIILNQSTNNTIGNQGPYANSNELLNGQFVYNGNLTNSDSIRQSLTTKNIYVDVPKQSVINLNTQPVPTFQNLTSYIDENNNLAIGGPGKQAVDVLAGLVSGQGVGLNVTNGSLIANEDIRSTLLGRTLGATGVINDTQLGNIGGQQLLAHVGYNAAFGLQQETLGKLNLNPLTLLQGKPLVTLNYSITVPKGKVGKILNFAANVLGTQSPVSLLEQSSSIFTFGNKLEYIGQGNIQRANEMIANSGMGQVQSLMNHMRANLMISNDPEGTSLRQGYAPGYKDGRKSKGEETGDGTNSNLYARADGNGGIIDFLNGKTNSPMSSGNYDRSGQISDDGWNEDYHGGFSNISDRPLSLSDSEIERGFEVNIMQYRNGFGWEDTNNNIPADEKAFTPNSIFKNPKTLLYKTKKLFESNNMKTLITGHGVKDDNQSQIQSAVSRINRFVSKGSGVLSYNSLINGETDDPAKVFCRTWTVFDRYDNVLDLQKSRGLYGSINKNIFRKNVEYSVLDDNGFVKVSPLKSYNTSGDLVNDVKKYMFSIENLAWCDDLTNLLPCEIGPGDSLNGHKGRIMWFPPYDINFSESTSASWDKQNFIGRGEPMYTYNNTERSGNLSWKIIIDHPNYLNFIGGANGISTKNFEDYLASFFAGCMPLEETKIEQITTTEERNKTEVVNAQEKPAEKLEPETAPPAFNVYFPNDVYDIDKYPLYENGLQNPGTDPILYKDNITGANFGLSDYTEMCYQFNVNGRKTWSSVQCSETAGVTQGSDGRLEPDRTNFGLNATGTTPSYTGTRLGDKKYPSFRDQQYAKDLQNYLLTKCKNCKVEVVGYASTVGTFGDNRNDELSKLRSESVKDWLVKNVITDPPFTERVSIVAEGKGATEGGGGSCPTPNVIARKKNYLNSKNDVYGCKANRYVTVRFVVDPNLKPLENPKGEKTSETVTPPKIIVPQIPPSRFYTECDYFQKLSLTDPIVYQSIKEKIKYFQPAFHSTTPEGFNARLNFLQQCMRQGPTLGAGATNNPNNLAFGRPPVCILRIGDFYHTKIIIENLNFTFEPLVWDLNPEGVGVQPMICNVDMSFAFIGGSSLKGPINKLQNAVSFNYFANTEIYDPRADTIEITNSSGKIVNGESNISGSKPNKLTNPSDANGLSPNTTPDPNQTAQNDNANTGDNTQPITPAEEPKKYPGFDDKTGVYTTQYAQTLKYFGDNTIDWSPNLIIPKGTKVFIGKGDGGDLSDDGRQIYINKAQNPTKKITKGDKQVSAANDIFYNKVYLDCRDINIWASSIVGNKIDKANNYAGIYENSALSEILIKVFCKNNKIKTWEELTVTDNVNKTT